MRIPKPYILIFISGLTSCKITENNIAGKYSDYFNFEYSADLTLNQDKTFDYIFQAGMMPLKYKGIWWVSKDTLILCSNSKPASPKFVIQQISISDEPVVKIFVNDGLTAPVPSEYYLDRKKIYFFDTSVISYTRLKDTLSIYPFSYKPVMLIKADIKPGLIQIKVFRDPDDYFEDMKFLIRGGKLKELHEQKQTGLTLKFSLSTE